MTTTLSPRTSTPVRLDFSRDLNDIPGTVAAAIAQANYESNGANFGQFMVKAAAGGDFAAIWTSERGDTPIAFYAYTGSRSDGYLPLGDVAIPQQGAGVPPFSQIGTLLFGKISPGSDVFVHPTDFDWILDDRGSGNPRDISYWWPVAPDGYSAVGLCFGAGKPNTANYWCVKNTYLRKGASAQYWSDSGSHWKHHDGSLSIVGIDSTNGAPGGDEMLIAPPTYLSNEGRRQPYVLVGTKLFLPVDPVGVAEPSYDPNAGSGSVSKRGLQHVAVMPFTALPDPGFLTKPHDSPFYFLANEPYWLCNGSRSTPGGGQVSTSVTVGVSKTTSESFSRTTSISVGANVGIAAGDKGGFTAGISVTYTNEMNVTTEQTEHNDTSTTDTIKVDLPKQPVTQFWQRVQKLVVYRTDGTSVTSAHYGTNDSRFVPNGTVTSIV